VDSREKDVITDGKKVTLHLWDTAGQERMGFLTSSYYRAAQGVLVVFDVTAADSFRNIRIWNDEIERYASGYTTRAIVGSKIYLEQRAVEREQAQVYAKDIGYPYYEVSSKTGEGVEEAFLALATQILRHKEAVVLSSPVKKSTIILSPLDTERTDRKSKSRCIV